MTSALQASAKDLAAARTRGHNHCRSASEDHGSDEKNRSLDYFGILAEIALMDALERANLKPDGYQFLSSRPPSEPDFTLHGFRYDVKASPPGQAFANINAGKHEAQNTRPDFYVVCIFNAPDRFNVAIVPVADVDAWEQHPGANGRNKPYYRIRRDDLPLIASPDAFAPQTAEDTDEVMIDVFADL